MSDRLYRSTTDRVLSGVAGGLAELWDLDPALVRVVWALLVPLTGGLALLAYIVLAIVVPQGPPPPRPSSAAAGDVESPADDAAPPADTPAETAVRARRPRGRGSTGLIVGVALILAGVYLLLQEYVPGFEPERLWPFVLVGLGVVLLVMAVAGRRPGPGS